MHITPGYFHRKTEDKYKKEIPSSLIPRLLVVFTRQLGNLSANPGLVCFDLSFVTVTIVVLVTCRIMSYIAQHQFTNLPLIKKMLLISLLMSATLY